MFKTVCAHSLPMSLMIGPIVAFVRVAFYLRTELYERFWPTSSTTSRGEGVTEMWNFTHRGFGSRPLGIHLHLIFRLSFFLLHLFPSVSILHPLFLLCLLHNLISFLHHFLFTTTTTTVTTPASATTILTATITLFLLIHVAVTVHSFSFFFFSFMTHALFFQDLKWQIVSVPHTRILCWREIHSQDKGRLCI